uniref:Scaffoldin C n=1 Tax=Ruminococcus flavefaciens TaxID=1265 RepID=G9FEY8_RUMFL|nr:scaffoldin C [Ruminococcus flavefaciens]
MKTKKVVVGALPAAMLSLSVCSIAPVAVAANETVQISVGNATVEKAGEKFTVDVSLADVPAAGIQAIDFSIAFDNAIITIDEVKAGRITETGATGSDSTSAAAPLFDSYINNDEGYLCLAWSTSLDDASYWIKSDGVFCTISGTVSSNAKTNDKSDLKIVATDRETYPGSGVPNTNVSVGASQNGSPVRYGTSLTNGSVTVTGGSAVTLRGDANCDKEVNMADAVLIMQSQANPDVYGLGKADGITATGAANADVAGGTSDKGGDGVTNADAAAIQEYKLGLRTEL